jgi:cell pole-organizing protein PopZ
MSSSSPQHEPTMEEILASIRKIIADDTSEPSPPKHEAQILELTQEVHEEAAPAPVSTAPAPTSTALEPEQSTPVQLPTAKPEAMYTKSAAEPDDSAENEAPTPANEDTQMSSASQTFSHDGIFSDRARQAVDDTFASLDEVSQPRQRPAARAPSFETVEGNSVEAVFERAVRTSVDPVLDQWMNNHHDSLMSAMKPLIREWMDDHFPALLEGAVRDEVARVIKARGGR